MRMLKRFIKYVRTITYYVVEHVVYSETLCKYKTWYSTFMQGKHYKVLDREVWIQVVIGFGRNTSTQLCLFFYVS